MAAEPMTVNEARAKVAHLLREIALDIGRGDKFGRSLAGACAELAVYWARYVASDGNTRYTHVVSTSLAL